MCKFFRSTSIQNEASSLLARRSEIIESKGVMCRDVMGIFCSVMILSTGILLSISCSATQKNYSERDQQDRAMWPGCDKPEFKMKSLADCIESAFDRNKTFTIAALTLVAVGAFLLLAVGINKGLEHCRARSQLKNGLNEVQQNQQRLDLKL